MRPTLAACIAAALTLTAAVSVAQGPARRPVTVWMIQPEDRPDDATLLIAEKPITHETKHVAEGWGGPIAELVKVGADCQPTDAAASVVLEPDHGYINFFDLRRTVPPGGLTVFAADDPRRRCNMVTVRMVQYVVDSGYIGRDRVSIEYKAGDSSFVDQVDLVVRRAKSPPPPPPCRRRCSPEASPNSPPNP